MGSTTNIRHPNNEHQTEKKEYHKFMPLKTPRPWKDHNYNQGTSGFGLDILAELFDSIQSSACLNNKKSLELKMII